MKRPEIGNANVAEEAGMNHHGAPQTQPRDSGHSNHRWLMIACCIPMLAIAIGLVAAGVASPGFVFFAFACTAMMALMMGVGSRDDGGNRP